MYLVSRRYNKESHLLFRYFRLSFLPLRLDMWKISTAPRVFPRTILDPPSPWSLASNQKKKPCIYTHSRVLLQKFLINIYKHENPVGSRLEPRNHGGFRWRVERFVVGIGVHLESAREERGETSRDDSEAAEEGNGGGNRG